MTWLCSYDVADGRRRRRVFKVLKSLSRPIQKSVFLLDDEEGSVNHSLFSTMKNYLKDDDSFIMVPLCSDCLSDGLSTCTDVFASEGYQIW